ncbi:type IV pilus twitching motility protein PilT [Pseudogemmatithrix spongiicola]|uniref:Type IV pilus twitching motility protein PilT n=1 Tax=Pseudogemmatithrix spongiicola TaxID=3062599 RepID=A0AA49K0S9_9BACT|nr:type IV pilus twitching motility protein PilT [Gemmatimonadaceae bacterium 'strain 138']WKW15594.1 type IV pilus twitching motility protein PilT [Gemmatimonadaceae bacterium 'strain 318']
MAQLDKLLSVMISNRADELVLTEGAAAVLLSQGNERPVTKALTAPQIVALLKEIAPAPAHAALDAKQPTKFQYMSEDSVFAARAMVLGDGKLSVRIQVDADGEFKRSTGMFTRVVLPEEPSAPSAAAMPNVKEAAVDPAGAREAMEKLLRMLVEQGGSDLHMRVGEPPILRKSGEMHRVEGQPKLDPATTEALLASIMPERNQKEFRESNDTDFAYEIAGVARFRANVLRDRKGWAAVFRVIPNTIITADQLGLSQEVQNLCYLTKGLVLVTGPTGSGKSTTLSGMIDLVNRSRNDHVITIEDPIEFVHENKNCIMTQRQVGVHTGSFKSALRAALREDPDIILVGELRDLETVSIAIETAETGHLVFGTLHTTTAASTIDRLIDQFPADRQEQVRTMLSESLKGVISQVLCKKIGGGRVAAREILLVTPAISNLIREGKTFQIPSIMQTSKRLGMITMNDTLLELVEKKLVEPKEAYMKSVDKGSFVNSLKAKGFDVSFVEADEPGGAKPAMGGPAAKPGAKK